MASFLEAEILDGPNKGLTIGQCIAMGHIMTMTSDEAKLVLRDMPIAPLVDRIKALTQEA